MAAKRRSRDQQQPFLPGMTGETDETRPILPFPLALDENPETAEIGDLPSSNESLAPLALENDRSVNDDKSSAWDLSDEKGNPPDLTGKTVYVIDSFSLIFQVFHALPAMSSPKGEPVGAVFGFTKDILFLLEQKRPDYLFCAFDMKGPTFRDAMVADYKAHRSEMPVDLIPQFSSIRRVLDAMGVPVLECPAHEADDILATVARITTEQGGECVLVSGDKDCRQLLSERVKIFNIRKNILFGPEELKADWGIAPEQVIDYQALVGDSVDNIKGVPGIGKKTAPELLQKYGTLDNLLNKAAEIDKKKIRENLLAGREQALVSRELARLKVDSPVEIFWSRGATSRFHPAQAAGYFRDFGFRTLALKWGTASDEQLLLTPPETKFEIVTAPDRMFEVVEQLRTAGKFVLHLLTTNRTPRWAEILGCAFVLPDKRAYYFALQSPNPSSVLDPLEAVAALRNVLENEQIKKSGHDLKTAVVCLLGMGVEIKGLDCDAMLAGYLLDAGERGHGLMELAKRHLDQAAPPMPEAASSGSSSSLSENRWEQVPLASLAKYAVDCAALIQHLQPVLFEKMEQAELTTLYRDVELPLLTLLAEMEFTGVRIDLAQLKLLSADFRQRLIVLEQEIYETAGEIFNISSPKQLAQILFEKHNLPILRKTKTGPSTDADVLEELAAQHPLPAKIIEYRQFAKLQNTYVEAIPQLVHPVTHRVHATLNQAVAATGRLSSSDPNLQNIPIRTKSGREIRSAFLPGPDGWQFLAADYSQIELRVLAHFSQDSAMLAAFARDEDIHTRVASEVFHVPPEQVDSNMRRTAKAVNFGVIYGQSPYGLAKALGISQDDAAKFIDAYFAGYPGVERFLNEILAACFRDGYVKTMLGRRRAIRGIREPNMTDMTESSATPSSRSRNMSEREAINTVIQGSAADLIKLAMLRIQQRLRRKPWDAKLILQIHDELILECSPDCLNDLGQMVREEMSSAFTLSVPLKVDLKSGRNWAECELWA